ncbi:MAG: hypothetical protein ABR956_11340 [Terracidiphilus sp.]|jgi:hypothetical protein
MQNRRFHAIFVPILAFSVVMSGSSALAATPDFTITATKVTMSSAASSGTGSSTFALTSVNGYTGSVRVACSYPDLPAGVQGPYCGGGPAAPALALNANQVVKGTIAFFFCSDMTCPVSLPRREGHRRVPGLALAGGLLFGFALCRRAAPALVLFLLAIGALAGLAGISACSNNAMTPGTYAYTITATDANTNASVTTSTNVTVP